MKRAGKGAQRMEDEEGRHGELERALLKHNQLDGRLK